MPTYNAAKWVCASIDAVIAQTYPHVEFIAVDDGSQDDTVAVVREKLTRDFKGDWQVIELGTNRGPSAARNVGLRAARGEWVQFMDSDDLIPPTKFAEEMAECVRAAPDVAAVYSPWRRCYVDDGKITWEGGLVDPDMDGRQPIMCLVGGNRPLHGAGLARRSVLQRIGGLDETLRFWEFEELNYRLAMAGRFARVPGKEPRYFWRMHREKIYIGREEARYRSTPVALGWISLILKATGGRPITDIGLSAAERRDLLDDCTIWGRLLYAQDRPAFRQYLQMARTLDPNIAPVGPKYVKIASRYFGYERAEGLAKLCRMPRSRVRKFLQSLELRPQPSVFDWD
ncbi:MAG TPA: glycosyltransferase family A protein [Rhodopila sp.]|uniref:glycosyltransferase family A protein n=1 Tax=Rhodopila sp. TaxID=2480087 RepID=UPI002C4DADAB|nr:glycosyltransferase family A protein [Rhodopila sp.]HVY14531.1 glycosyltransferase family A protein [Rhodopila sp.]